MPVNGCNAGRHPNFPHDRLRGQIDEDEAGSPAISTGRGPSNHELVLGAEAGLCGADKIGQALKDVEWGLELPQIPHLKQIAAFK